MVVVMPPPWKTDADVKMVSLVIVSVVSGAMARMMTAVSAAPLVNRRPPHVAHGSLACVACNRGTSCAHRMTPAPGALREHGLDIRQQGKSQKDRDPFHLSLLVLLAVRKV
jgi:hypothetical protein